MMKTFRACVLFAFIVGTASYGLVFSTCAIDPKGSCAILGFSPVQPTANQAFVTNGGNPDDPSDAGSSALIF
jgi:hypothetical protein